VDDLSSGERDLASTIVVGIDGSETSWRAAAYAVGLARRQSGHSHLVFVCVVPVSGLTALAPQVVPATAESTAQMMTEIAGTLERGLADLGLRWKIVTRKGNPFAELVRVANEARADTVVVGASSRLGHRVAGSMAARLVKAHHWPVVVVP
jgi:nucleotide-binding universal stress UspA family protein